MGRFTHFKDVQVVRDIIKEFDEDFSGRISIREFRKALHKFGQYLTMSEVCFIFEQLEIPVNQDMTQHDLERFMADVAKYMPPKGTKQSFWESPPSKQVDFAMRYFF